MINHFGSKQERLLDPLLDKVALGSAGGPTSFRILGSTDPSSSCNSALGKGGGGGGMDTTDPTDGSRLVLEDVTGRPSSSSLKLSSSLTSTSLKKNRSEKRSAKFCSVQLIAIHCHSNQLLRYVTVINASEQLFRLVNNSNKLVNNLATSIECPVEVTDIKMIVYFSL